MQIKLYCHITVVKIRPIFVFLSFDFVVKYDSDKFFDRFCEIRPFSLKVN